MISGPLAWLDPKPPNPVKIMGATSFNADGYREFVHKKEKDIAYLHLNV